MVNIKPQHKPKILAAHFAAAMKTNQPYDELEAFVHYYRSDEYQLLKQWWGDMDALRTLRHAEQLLRHSSPDDKRRPNPINWLSQQKDTILFKDEPIGKIYNYSRTVLPQEAQIKIAYDSLIERFMAFLQQERCAIYLSENKLTVSLFIPKTDFQLEDEWQQFVQFAYSKDELYKSFTLFVNHMKLTNRGFGYVQFPSVTEAMKLWQAAFYIATLHERVVLYPDNYKKAKTDEEKKAALEANREELKQILTGLRRELPANNHCFDEAARLSLQFTRTGRCQFSYGTVKPRAKGGKIENKIVDILNEPEHTLTCPLEPIDEIYQRQVRIAGDNAKNHCYSCGRQLLSKDKRFKGEANRFVFSASSQRLQSGSSQAQPPICLDCLAIAFVCPIKLTSGTIIVRLSPNSEDNQWLSTEKYVRMLTLGELNLIAGRYLLVNCREFVSGQGGLTAVSEKIGQVQYALWRVAQTLPTEAIEKMQFTLFAGESEIPLKPRHLVWLSHLNDSFSPPLIVNQKDNIRLGQAIRLIQRNEVISAIYTLITAEPNEANSIQDWSYSEKRSLEELRKKHWTLLKGDKLMAKQAALYRDVAALTGLIYPYCDYVRRKLREAEKDSDTVRREVKKLIEKVVNPSFFNYQAAETLRGTRAKMFRNDDNYFCYDEAKRLLKEKLKLDLSEREEPHEKGQEQLSIYFDDILNAYAELFTTYNKAEQRKLCYQLKLNLYAKFPELP